MGEKTRKRREVGGRGGGGEWREAKRSRISADDTKNDGYAVGKSTPFGRVPEDEDDDERRARFTSSTP
ncbi:hypothetical protein K0M31_003165 [Melipona bicolor]|uniref:Uncharacterized protein n=1 Tax=Melipona bicolor TaxID=60889 RepID=A0AA40FYB0_9HYME|nr:hypothetical protein K0M31_003165 [Melipona bicolor]